MSDVKEIAIKVEGVYKNFKLPHERTGTLKSTALQLFRKRFRANTYETQHALKDVSFTIHKGEFFGIVGRNGSGKSTLLKMLAGIYQPTKGNIVVNGSLVPFIELGVGFNGELTGRENVYLNGALLGFSEEQVDSLYDDIVEFAELKAFMDQKLKNYSSGMQVRLAFSLATRVDTEILVVDEVLAVGDADFQRKCFDYFKKLKKDNKTVVFVSHDMNSVREYCDRALLIDESKVVEVGDVDRVATLYTRMFFDKDASVNGDDLSKKRWGNGAIKYDSVEVTASHDTVNMSLGVTVFKSVDSPNFGFTIRNSAGQAILGTNTTIKKQTISKVVAGEKLNIIWSFDNMLGDGEYYIEPAIVYQNGDVCDWWEEAKRFSIRKEEKTPYITNPHVNVMIDRKKKKHD